MKYIDVAYSNMSRINEALHTEDTLDTRWADKNSNGSTSIGSKTYDAVVFDVLRVPPEDFASQLTILDIEVFTKIQPEELRSCAWNKKEKLKKAPAVVQFTRKFNHVCFWAVNQILSCQTPKVRADVLSHFIKIARKLHDLNNLHSEFAVLSALQSAPIFRLSKTWALISRKDKFIYEKMLELFSENNNFEKLRDYMATAKLPCIPYLGLYLTDLVYIDVAYLRGTDLSMRRKEKVLQNVATLQTSTYDHLPVINHIQTYLKSVRYIEELQKFVEEDNFKLSLKLEPQIRPADQLGSSFSSKDDSLLSSRRKTFHSSVNLLTIPFGDCISGTSATMPCQGNAKYTPGHRKSRSLGTNIFTACQQQQQHSSKAFSPFLGRHLLDDSVLEDTLSPLQRRSSFSSSESRDNLCLGSDEFFIPMKHSLSDELFLDSGARFQGCLKRKTIMKDGKRPAVTAWMRYWVALWGTSLLYYSPKTLRGQQRSDFKTNPNKMTSIVGWMVIRVENSLQPDVFQLTDPSKGNMYKFRAGHREKALEWCEHLYAATRHSREQLPANLMTFE